MAHLYKVKEWQSGSQRWYCNDTSEISSGAECWWTPARFLNMSLNDYVLLLINRFKVTDISYDKQTNVLTFSWSNYTDCHNYVLWINKQSRQNQWWCGNRE